MGGAQINVGVSRAGVGYIVGKLDAENEKEQCLYATG